MPMIPQRRAGHSAITPRARAPGSRGLVVARPRSMLTILIILLLVSLLFGGLGYGRFGAAGLGPAGILVLILILLAVTGRL